MRQQLAKTVMEIMDKDERVVVLLGDIGVFAFRDVFKKYPKRVYNVGICEQSMVGLGAGLAIAGFIPIIHTIEPFLVDRAYEQIKIDFGYQELIGTIIGVDVSETAPNLGFTHQCPYAIEKMHMIKELRAYEPTDAQDFDFYLKHQYDKHLNYFRIK